VRRFSIASREIFILKITKYVRLETDPLDDIVSLLEGRVFHVTKLAHLDSIRTDGEIKPNGDGSLETTFGYVNAFFRKRNCVSLFDYRQQPTDENARNKCSPFQPARSDPGSDGIAILFLKPEAYADLIPWTRSREEEAWREQIVPYVEAGYPGSISIDLIDEIICLELEEVPDSHAAILRKALRKAHRTGS